MDENEINDVRRTLKSQLISVSAPEDVTLPSAVSKRWFLIAGSVTLASGLVFLSVTRIQSERPQTDRPAPAATRPSTESLLEPATGAALECTAPWVRGDKAPNEDASSVLRDHVPTWLPPGLGLVDVYEGDEARVRWASGDCRQLFVSTSPSGGSPVESWSPLDGGSAEAATCYSPELGDAECWSTSRDFGDVQISLQTLGLGREETERIIESIP